MDTPLNDQLVLSGRGAGSRLVRCVSKRRFVAGFILMGSLGLAACASPRSTPSPATATLAPSQSPIITQSATPTVTPTRLPTRTARPTHTPTAIAWLDPRWNVPAWQVGAGNVQTASWAGEDRVAVTLGDVHYSVSAEGEALPAPTPAPDLLPSEPDSPAPDRQHTFAVSDGQVSLYDAGQTEPLGSAVLTLEFGPDDVRWSPDSRRALLVADEGLYWWDVSEPTPVQLEPQLTFPLVWSPSGDRLLYLTSADTLKILSSPRQGVESPKLNIGGLSDFLWWQSPSIVAVGTTGAWSRTTYYLDADTGRYLFYWENDFFMSRSPAFSPDGSWAVVDHSIRPWSEDLAGWAPYIDQRYEIVDLETGTTTEWLGETGAQFLDWVGWSSDSSRFWLISRPASLESLPDPRFPFGLLALDPATGSVEPLLDQAVFARLTPDRARAWVVFPARHASVDTLGLDGGLFDLSTLELVGRAPVSDVVDYPIPDDHGSFPGAWTADGAWLVYADRQGGVSLVNAQTGAITAVGADLPLPDESFLPIRFDWAADQRHLLIQLDAELWIVDVSAITGRSSVTP